MRQCVNKCINIEDGSAVLPERLAPSTSATLPGNYPIRKTVLCLWELVEFGDADRFRREHRVEDSLDKMRARRPDRDIEQAVRDPVGDLDAVAAAAVGERGAARSAARRGGNEWVHAIRTRCATDM